LLDLLDLGFLAGDLLFHFLHDSLVVLDLFLGVGALFAYSNDCIRDLRILYQSVGKTVFNLKEKRRESFVFLGYCLEC
jgi:hypothetical protein